MKAEKKTFAKGTPHTSYVEIITSLETLRHQKGGKDIYIYVLKKKKTFFQQHVFTFT